MSSSSNSNDEMDAADGLVSLSTYAYRDDQNNESDVTLTGATTASSSRTDDTSTARGRDSELSSDVINSTSPSSETDENTSSLEAGWFLIILFIILKGINTYLE